MMRILISLLPIFLLTGCTGDLQKSFKTSEIADQQDGFYALREDSCDPLMVSENQSKEDFLFLIADESLEGVPEIGENQLILKSGVEPGEVKLVPLRELSYTFGFFLYHSERGYQISDLVQGSSAGQELADTDPESRIFRVGGEVLARNYISEMNTITGLKKGEKYEITFLKGTKEEKFEVLADSLLLSGNAEEEIPLKLSYTAAGYALLTAEKELDSGYYYCLSDLGNLYPGRIFHKSK